MTQIKKVKTSEGVQFYPQTHTKAVIDDNGYTAESRLGALQDEINQAQLAVGAVPSDLTPTGNSSNWVTSGGVYNALTELEAEVDNRTIITEQNEIAISSLTSTSGNIIREDGKWNNGGSNYIFYTYACSPGDKFIITANVTATSFYAWLANLTRSNGGNVSYATGETGRHAITHNTTTDILTAPAGTAYLYICKQNGNVVQTPQHLYSIMQTSLKTAVENNADNIALNAAAIENTDRSYSKITEIDLDNYPDQVRRIEMASGTFGGNTVTGKHIFVSIKSNSKYEITTANNGSNLHYTWTTEASKSPIGGTSPSYCSGYTNVIALSPGKTYTLESPSDARYLYLTTLLTSVDTRPTYLAKYESLPDRLTGFESDIESLNSSLTAETVLNDFETDSFTGTSNITVSKVTEDNGWLVTNVTKTDSNYALYVLPSNMVVGRRYKISYDYECSLSSNPWWWMITASNTTTTLGVGTALYNGTGHRDWIYTHVSGGVYLRLASSSQNSGSTAKLTNIVISEIDDIDTVVERLTTLEEGGEKGHREIVKTEVLSNNTGKYIGEKIVINEEHTFSLSSYMSAGKTHQSGTVWGDYFFMISDTMTSIYVYNLSTKTLLYTWSGSALDSAHHCNQCTFGIEYYDASDPFPLLYVSVNNALSGTYAGRCSQEVYRISGTWDSTANEYTAFTFTKVQTIWLPDMTAENALGNANMAIDRRRQLMVFYSRNNISTDSNYQICRITEMEIPHFRNTSNNVVETVILDKKDILTSYEIPTTATYMQGGVIQDGKLYIAKGYANVNVIALYVVDLYGKALVASIDLLGNGYTWEPEGVFIYDGKLMTSANNGSVYYFTFT